MNRITVSWFSAGVSSAVATWLVRDQVDRIIYTHIDDQHSDTMRFVKDCEAWFGKPIEILQSPYRTVASAWKASGWRMAHAPSGHAPCTNYLKRRVRKEWECANQWFTTFRYIWGMDCDEAARADRLRETMREVEHLFPLVEHGITKEEAHGILKRAGVKRPAMYDLGYHNNNCIGCVKGGKGYWNKIRVDFPDVFAARAALEREIGGTCINGTWLDKLDPTAGRDEGPILEECGAMCEVLPNAGPHAEAVADSVQADVGRCCGNCLHFRLIDLARIPHCGTTPPRGGRCIVGRIAPDGETCCGTWTANDGGERRLPPKGSA